MRRPIRIQILLPFTVTLIVAVGIIASTSAWLAVRRAEERTLSQIRSVVDTLTGSSVPYYHESVLRQMHGLSGAEFLALNQNMQQVAGTISTEQDLGLVAEQVPLITSDRGLSDLPIVSVGQRRYLGARVAADGSLGVVSLLILYPESSWREARSAVVWPPLIVGVATVAVMAAISAFLSARIARRVRSVQELLGEIADGRFPDVDAVDEATSTANVDEVDDLVESANRLSNQLQELQDTIRRTERVRLIAQLAGGLAHQLRNAVTGARMAVQLHQKRCSGPENDESLSVALRQLSLTEEQVRGLLSLSRQEPRDPEPASTEELIEEINRLVDAQARHAHVELTVSTVVPTGCRIADSAGFRTAVLNLMLNAVEAAGAGGSVHVDARVVDDSLVVEVQDSGAGPPRELQETLFEPFVTSKPEGVGLGLALARQAAEDQGGSLSWSRKDEQTIFRLTIRQ